MFQRLLNSELEWMSFIDSNYPDSDWHRSCWNIPEGPGISPTETPTQYPCVVVYKETSNPNSRRDDIDYMFIYLGDFFEGGIEDEEK